MDEPNTSGKLTEPLLDKKEMEDFYNTKKFVAERAHLMPGQEKADFQEQDSAVRSRGRSLSMITDPDEFNTARKMDPVEYYYLHLWGEALDDDQSDDANAALDDTWTAQELIELKNAEGWEK